MTFEADGLRKVMSTLLTGALLATSALVPLLDRNESANAPVLETEHHASTCVVGHDHTICTQVGANLWIAPADGSTVGHQPGLQLLASPGTEHLGSPRIPSSAWTRAPPPA